MAKVKGPGDIKVSKKKFVYADLPKDMDECFYDLELQEVKEVGEAGNIAFIWKVLDTDTKVKADSTVSTMLFPFQKLAHIYFWKELFSIAIVLGGREVTQKRMDKLKEKYKTVKSAFMSNDEKYIGKRARLTLKQRTNDADEVKTDKTWEPVGEDDDE